MASAFCNYIYFKKRCRALIKKIKKRINEIITNDEPLREHLLNDLAFLDNEVKNISLKNHTEIEIIAYMFRIIANLLGWDNLEGKFYRTPIYYQTKDNREAGRHGNRNYRLGEDKNLFLLSLKNTNRQERHGKNQRKTNQLLQKEPPDHF